MCLLVICSFSVEYFLFRSESHFCFVLFFGFSRQGFSVVLEPKIMFLFTGARGDYTGAIACVWRSEDNLWELVLASTTWVLGTGLCCQRWQQAPLPTEPSHALKIFFNLLVLLLLFLRQGLNCIALASLKLTL